MKLMRCLPAVVFVIVSACSDKPAVEMRRAVAPEQAPPAAAPAAEAPAAPAAKRTAEPIEVRDARAASSGPATQAARDAGVNTDAAVLADFTRRVNAYVALHKTAAKGDARLKETDEAGDIAKAQDELAARMIAARPNAQQGDIFTPEIRNRFRLLLAPELKGEEGRDARAVMKDDAPPPGSIPFKANAKYPEGQPKPTVPANVLLHLPTLPQPLEYRVIGRHLLLLDTNANIIVDYIPNAIR